MSKMTLGDWLESYKKSWVELDIDLLVPLFTEDAVYQESPYVMPLHGSQLRHILDDQQGRQSGGRIDLEIWSQEGDTVIARYSTSTHRAGKEEQLRDGVLILRFAADGRCSNLRQWYHVHAAGAPPTKGLVENP